MKNLCIKAIEGDLCVCLRQTKVTENIVDSKCHILVTVTHDYDYVFSENGLVAYKHGKLIGQEVSYI